MRRPAIGRKEAEEIGLPIKPVSAELDLAMWSLLEQYETLLDLRKPFDAEAALGPTTDEGRAPAIVAVIESAAITTAHRGTIQFKRIRQTAGPVAANLNLNVQLPQNIPPQDIPQQIIQQLMQQVQNEVPRIVQEQVKAQSPVMGHQIQPIGFTWEDVTNEGI